MNTFAHIDGALHCEQVSLETIASRHGTPTYVYSHQTIQNAFLSYQQALEGRAHLICYAVKANSNLAVLNMLTQLGSGFDVVSLGELERVIAAGGDPAKIVFSGVGKTAPEMRRGLELGIKCFNIESEAELHVLAEIVGDAGPLPLSQYGSTRRRCGHTPLYFHRLRENKFGVDVDTARRLYRQADAMNLLEPVGIDCHIGSQIVDIQPFIASLDCLLRLIDELKEDGITLHPLDIGGGLGVPYETEAPSVKEYVAALAERLTDRDLELLLEPGRSIVAMAGALLTRVEYLKPNDIRQFAIVDAAMNDLLRPSLYGVWQDIEAVRPRKEKPKPGISWGPSPKPVIFWGKIAFLPVSGRSTGCHGRGGVWLQHGIKLQQPHTTSGNTGHWRSRPCDRPTRDAGCTVGTGSDPGGNMA